MIASATNAPLANVNIHAFLFSIYRQHAATSTAHPEGNAISLRIG